MLNTQVVSEVVPGVVVPLHARLCDTAEGAWHEVGTFMRLRAARRPFSVRLAPDAVVLGPVFEAAIGPPLPHGLPVRVDFALGLNGHLTQLAECRLTPVLGREVERIAARAGRIAGGPRGLRSNWPTDAMIAAIRRG